MAFLDGYLIIKHTPRWEFILNIALSIANEKIEGQVRPLGPVLPLQFTRPGKGGGRNFVTPASRPKRLDRFVLEQRTTLAHIESWPGLATLAQDGGTARFGDSFYQLGGGGFHLFPRDK